MHRGRWKRYKSYELPPKPKLPDGIIKICTIHGNLKSKEVRIKDKNRIAKDGHRIVCKMCKYCDNNNSKAWKEKSGYKPKYKPGRHRKRIYGISYEEYQKMFEDRSGKCDICGKIETKILHKKLMDLSVDHNHISGHIRGLLCFKCNVAFGLLDENIQTMKNMILYKKSRG